VRLLEEPKSIILNSQWLLVEKLQVENSCSKIINTVRSMPLNYNIVETPFSIYVTLRKSLAKNATTAFENIKSKSSDDNVKKLEKANQSLNANLEDAILKLEDNSKTIYELNEKVDILLAKLELSEQISDKKNAVDVVKDSEIEALNIGNKRLVNENKALKVDLKEVAKRL
jgi:hypothetical protein